MTIDLILGRTAITPAALHQLDQESIPPALRRHATGDWGNVDAEDWRANDLAVVEGARVLSAYTDSRGVRFWIITEADRSVTTILLPEDY